MRFRFSLRRLPQQWSAGLGPYAPVLIIVGLGGIVAHFLTFSNNFVIGAAAFAPYLMAVLPVAVVVAAIGRHWFGLVMASALTLVSIATQAPLYVTSGPPYAGPLITMVTANLRLGQADPKSVVQLVQVHHVDVFAAQELTPAERLALARAGLDSALPYDVVDARDFASGAGLWSKYPLTRQQISRSFTFSMVSADVAVPGARSSVTLVATHMPGPWPQPPGQWLADMQRLPGTLRSFADPGDPVLVGGDFNSTPDVAQFRRLLSDGYHDSAEQAGAGITATYPADTWYPPLIAIDHLLTFRATARSVTTVSVPGSDHRGLLVEIRLPA